MKKISFVVIFLIFNSIFGQELSIKATVKDADTKEPIPNVEIFVNSNPNNGTITDINGYFVLKGVKSTDTLAFHSLGHKVKRLAVSEIKEVVFLTPYVNQLDQVVITASGQMEKQKSVPASISQISPVELSEINPVSLDEVLNRTPGVMMVDLGNEQHSMSIRQPISYKSVYLYLEDGLPLRAPGLFNHNALIEINHEAVKKVEIIRGPYSTLYGSNAIGGAINFITKEPSFNRVKLSANNNGYRMVSGQISKEFDKTDIISTISYSGRRNGYREHSDYDKFGFFIKMNNNLGEKVSLKSMIDYIDYKTDMTGGLDSIYFYGKDYTSQYRFTYRKAKALRYYSKLYYNINEHNQTNFTLFGRYNDMAQNPHYRIKDDYDPYTGQGDPNLAHGQINDNEFYSIGFVVQHNFHKGAFSATAGLSVDNSPASYWAKYIQVHKTDDAIYDSYIETDSMLTNYDVNVWNRAFYMNATYEVTKDIKLLGGFRADYIKYDFDNHLSAGYYSGAPDSEDVFDAFTPRLGFIANLDGHLSFYGNFSKGFRPPEVGELYRGVDVPSLEPVYYKNYEGGARISFDNKLFADLTYYYLRAENEIISVRLLDGSYENQNVAETTHRGFEFGIQYFVSNELDFTVNGAYSEHIYDNYGSYSGNVMPGSPPLIFNTQIRYRPSFWKGSYLIFEMFHVDPYYMDKANTTIYEGYQIYNLRLGKRFDRFKVWLNVLNLTDELYATSASLSWGRKSYRPGERRSFNLGISYLF